MRMTAPANSDRASAVDGGEMKARRMWEVGRGAWEMGRGRGTPTPPPPNYWTALVHLDVPVDAVDKHTGGEETDGATHDGDSTAEHCHVGEVVACLQQAGHAAAKWDGITRVAHGRRRRGGRVQHSTVE